MINKLVIHVNQNFGFCIFSQIDFKNEKSTKLIYQHEYNFKTEAFYQLLRMIVS